MGKPELAWLVQRIRQRLERGEGLQGSVTLRGATNEQRAATDRLLGRLPSTGTTLTVQLQRLDLLLRHAELCGGLKEAVEALTGPVEDQRARQALLEEKWSSLFDEAERSCSSREAKNWLRELRETGLVRRLSRQNVETARRYLQLSLNVIARLPAKGVPLAELSAEATGDSHSLDVGWPLGTLTVRAAGLLGGVESWDDAEARRDAWASVGVLCDELSAPVLTLNLRGDLQSISGRALQLHAEAGEPYRLTVRQLLRQPPDFEPARLGPRVYVCENPTVVAAAANRLGARSAPLICVEGQP
ncbi:MAG TPA: TIGR02679 family protein, partial [Anaerolineales bacterium]